jgi:hypothetical protein
MTPQNRPLDSLKTHLLNPLTKQSLGLSDQALGRYLVDFLTIERGIIEHRNHLAGDRVALICKAYYLCLFCIVGRSIGGLEGLSGNAREGRDPQWSRWRVDLLVELRKLGQGISVAPQRHRQRIIGNNIEDDAPVMSVVVQQLRQAEDRGPDIGMIGQQGAGLAEIPYPRTDNTQPGLYDFFLEIAVVPDEVPRLHEAARSISRRRAKRRRMSGSGQEVIRVAEQDKVGRG